ncbi:kyphoscoliosis peptidase [Cladophialophora carrionii]|uniref:Kyphoscoliosis peptidase n=1 Tax=Cladophialophora carrionii TaxID=86049 RepID=A0A1C1C9Y7_9EURO|nr:kyphoscoliosis peptidase [Cladophialophora carrionii]
MAEDPQPLTLKERIQALNAAHIGRIPGEPPRPSSQPPPIAAQRPVVVKQHSVNIPPEKVNGSVLDSRPANLPAPPPPPVRKQPPPLPSRNTSREEQRRGSVASTVSSGTNDTSSTKTSTIRTKSTDSLNRVKAPAWGECQLPALPPRNTNPQAATRKSDEHPSYANRVPSATAVVTSVLTQKARPAPPPRPSLPPRRPSAKHENSQQEPAADVPIRKMPPMPSAESIERAKRAAFGYNTPKEQQTAQRPAAVIEPVQSPIRLPISFPVRQPSLPCQSKENLPVTPRDAEATRQPHTQPAPPPVPVSSRPDLSAIQATKPKFAAPSSNGSLSPTVDVCLVCRDFSGPDHQATLFPRTQVTSLQTLAQQLTAPFPSPTDKARAIFSWLHHNIAYDVVSFFNNNVRGSTPQSTLQTGLAVCEGYAALFTNLATYAGLESVVISGHGKGYGFSSLAPGSPLPPYNAGHAWNAVRIDNGEWKLIDACWGAGHVQGPGQPYVQKFHSECFTMSNEEFGIKHFPGNKDHFFLPGGRRMSWEEYIVIDPASWPDMVEGPTIFTNAKEDYSIGEKTVYPRARKINVRQQSGTVVRFQFGLRCAHWTLEHHTRKGPPPVFVVQVGGVDGRNKDLVPLEYYPGPAGQGGDLWCADIPACDLGAPGQTVTLFAITSFGNRQDCRGLSVREFREGKGRVGMGFTGVAAWDLV